jgi:hypothetical protein
MPARAVGRSMRKASEATTVNKIVQVLGGIVSGAEREGFLGKVLFRRPHYLGAMPDPFCRQTAVKAVLAVDEGFMIGWSHLQVEGLADQPRKLQLD